MGLFKLAAKLFHEALEIPHSFHDLSRGRLGSLGSLGSLGQPLFGGGILSNTLEAPGPSRRAIGGWDNTGDAGSATVRAG